MSEILAVCEAEQRPCWVAIHPNRALTSARTGGSTPDVVSARRVRQIYTKLEERLARHRYRDHFIDLIDIFDGGEREGYFTDTVHVADKGQPIIAEALAGVIAPALTKPLPKGRAVDRCAVLLQPQVLADVPVDRISPALADGKVSSSDGVLSLHVGPHQWEWGAHAPIELDPAWSTRDLILRVRFAVTQGDLAVVAVDPATGKDLSPERPLKAGFGESAVYLPIRGHPKAISLIFKKTLPDGVPTEAIVREISVLAK